MLLRTYLHPRARGRVYDLQGALPVGPALPAAALLDARSLFFLRLLLQSLVLFLELDKVR